jgi:hypothetical protein
MADAARADFVAVAIEEGDGELRGFQPVFFRGLAERRDREREREHEPAGANGRAFRDRLDQVPAPPAGDVEPIHENGVALVQLTAPAARVIEPRVDARIQIEEEARKFRLPALRPRIIVEQVAQGLVLPVALISALLWFQRRFSAALVSVNRISIHEFRERTFSDAWCCRHNYGCTGQISSSSGLILSRIAAPALLHQGYRVNGNVPFCGRMGIGMGCFGYRGNGWLGMDCGSCWRR